MFRWFVFLAIPAFAQQPGVGFAVIGVAASQSARINVYNEAPSALPSNPPQDVPAQQGCSVVLQFFAADGGLLKEQTIDNLAPGKIAFLDYTPADRPSKELRTPIRAVARFGQVGGGANPAPGTLAPCQVVPNLEIYEADTGKTQLLLTETRPLSTRQISLP